eukprot:gb/GEZN01001284.1/.p1 GENE.gb/GEZN01001284.1/~~gb/GEZN01001284.1/.p1  ORF type:complete len:881 (+),score=137.71 gb/GEZN01001284.1/:340-2643(+)
MLNFSLTGNKSKENRSEYKTPEPGDKVRSRSFRLFGRNSLTSRTSKAVVPAENQHNHPQQERGDLFYDAVTEDNFFTQPKKRKGSDGNMIAVSKPLPEEEPVILTVWIVMTGTAKRPRTNLRMLKVFDGLPKAKGLTKLAEKQLVVENVVGVKMHFQTGGAVKKKADRFHDSLVKSLSHVPRNGTELDGRSEDGTCILEADFSSMAIGQGDGKDNTRRRAVGIQRQERDKQGQVWFQLMFADGMTAWCPEAKLLAKARGAALIAAYHSQLLELKSPSISQSVHLNGGANDGQPPHGFPGNLYERPADTLETQRKYRRWEAYLRKFVTLEKSSALRILVRGGIPPGLRGHVWQQLSGSKAKQENAKPNYYNLLVEKANGRREKEKKEAFEKRMSMQKITQTTSLEEIERDMRRTFPANRTFQSSSALQALNNILSAFSVHNKKVGYCQSMTFLTAMLLLFMEEEAAFWTLTVIVEDLFAVECASGRKVSYYQSDLAGVQIDQAVFRFLLKEKIPAADAMFTRCCTPIEPLTINWFLCMFVNSLPLETMLHVWDCIFYEGVEFVFRAALTLFKANEKMLDKCHSMQECVSLMQAFPVNCRDPVAFFKLAFDERWLGGFDLLPSRIASLRKQHSDMIMDMLRKTNGKHSVSRRDSLSPHWGVASLWRMWTEPLAPEVARELDPKFSSRLHLWHQLGNVMLGIEPAPAEPQEFDFTQHEEDDIDGFVLVSPLVPDGMDQMAKGASSKFSVELTTIGDDAGMHQRDDDDDEE